MFCTQSEFDCHQKFCQVRSACIMSACMCFCTHIHMGVHMCTYAHIPIDCPQRYREEWSIVPSHRRRILFLNLASVSLI